MQVGGGRYADRKPWGFATRYGLGFSICWPITSHAPDAESNWST